MTRLEVSFDEYDAECLTFLTEHFDTEGEHVSISDFPRFEELGRNHVMKVIRRYRRYQMVEFLNRGTITMLPKTLSVADQLRLPVENDSEPTTFSENEAECVRRLSDSFQSGSTQISVNELFANMDIDNGQKHAICESLKASGAINPTYQFGQRLPYTIQILPNVVKQHGQHKPADPVTTTGANSRTAWDTIYGIAVLWFGDPSTRFAKFFAVAGVALIAAPWWQPVLQQLAVKYLGIPETLLANADSAMFCSGWVLIAIALALYIWIKTTSTKTKVAIIGIGALLAFLAAFIGDFAKIRSSVDAMFPPSTNDVIDVAANKLSDGSLRVSILNDGLVSIENMSVELTDTLAEEGDFKIREINLIPPKGHELEKQSRFQVIKFSDPLFPKERVVVFVYADIQEGAYDFFWLRVNTQYGPSDPIRISHDPPDNSN